MWKHIVSSLILALFSVSSIKSSRDDDSKHVANNQRIFGGVTSERGSRPFQVALYLRVGASGAIGFCGGSLVHEQWVLTAAHCCFHGDEEVTHVQAILGAHSLYDRYENGRRLVNVEDIVVHPEWDPHTITNDLALLKLANVIQTSDTISIIRLPYLYNVTSNFAGVAATASGWGIAADDGKQVDGPLDGKQPPSPHRREQHEMRHPCVVTRVTFISPTLREITMTVTTDTYCNTMYMGNLPLNTICGFSVTSGTCKGDNGGPLTMFLSSSEELLLLGVTSFVDASGCNDDLPSVFTRVQRHLPWISGTTGIALD